MAKFTIERWRCDRCGTEADKWMRPNSAYEIRASVDHGTAGGTLLNWRELCVDCNDMVERLVRGMERDADLAERARIEAKENQHD